MKDLTPCICERCNAEHYGGNYFLCPDCEDLGPFTDGSITFDIFTLKDIPKMETH